MKWTKLRASIRSRIAPALSKHLDVHQARYRRTFEEVGRVWFTVDGEEVASFDTTSYGRKRSEMGDAIREVNDLRPYGETEGEYRAADDRPIHSSPCW